MEQQIKKNAPVVVRWDKDEWYAGIATSIWKSGAITVTYNDGTVEKYAPTEVKNIKSLSVEARRDGVYSDIEVRVLTRMGATIPVAMDASERKNLEHIDQTLKGLKLVPSKKVFDIKKPWVIYIRGDNQFIKTDRMARVEIRKVGPIYTIGSVLAKKNGNKNDGYIVWSFNRKVKPEKLRTTFDSMVEQLKTQIKGM